jgi:glycolate oxidase FAD binding subunit
MADPIRPRDALGVRDAVEDAVANGRTLEIVGQGSKHAIGRAAQWDRTLDLSGLSGVTLYEPAELVLSARAGTPIAEIEKLVEEHRQQLAFEPMDYGPILGEPARRGTLGGVLAANLSGPRRIAAGAARDHFLGLPPCRDAAKSSSRVAA